MLNAQFYTNLTKAENVNILNCGNHHTYVHTYMTSFVDMCDICHAMAGFDVTYNSRSPFSVVRAAPLPSSLPSLADPHGDLWRPPRGGSGDIPPEPWGAGEVAPLFLPARSMATRDAELIRCRHGEHGEPNAPARIGQK